MSSAALLSAPELTLPLAVAEADGTWPTVTEDTAIRPRITIRASRRATIVYCIV